MWTSARSGSGGGNVCQQSIRWATKQKPQLFSQSRGWLSWLLLGDSGLLAAYSLDVTYSIGSVCGRWGLSGGRDNTHCPARSFGRQRKYGSPQISLTVTWLWRLLVLASWLALRQAPRVTMLWSRSGARLARENGCILLFPVFIYGALIEGLPRLFCKY